MRNNMVYIIDKYHLSVDDKTYFGIEAIDKLEHANDEMKLKQLLDISRVPSFKYILAKEKAVAPSRAHHSDSGFDLTIIEPVKSFGNVTLYTTGVKVQPCPGMYFDLVPRSSISKSGHILANSVGIIDQSYTGEVMIALQKLDENAKDIELPCKIAQLIPRTWHHMVPTQVDSFEESSRGSGGFGSTS